MGKVTWLGEGEDGPQETTWANLAFKVGEAVETEDESTLRRASRNKFFKVEGYVMTPEGDPKVVPAPSTVSAQHSVPKPGEPLPTAPVSPEGGNGGEEEIPIGGNGEGIEATRARKPLRKV